MSRVHERLPFSTQNFCEKKTTSMCRLFNFINCTIMLMRKFHLLLYRKVIWIHYHHRVFVVACYKMITNKGAFLMDTLLISID